MSKNFDVIVVGTGPGGKNSAIELAGAGKKVAIVENDLWGGTCPNRGCDPKKILSYATKVKDQVHRLKGKAFTEEPEINWSDLMAFKESYIAPIPESTKKNFESVGIETIDGKAEFIDNQTMLINKEEYTAENFLIATGAKPSIIPIEGKEHFLTSDDFLSLKEMPEKITFVGGGFIAFELAAIASTVGTEVHIVHDNSQPLAAFDEELVNIVIEQLEAKGVTFHYNIQSSKLEKHGDSFTLSDDKEFELTSDLVFCSTGRIPNIEDLNLEKAGIKANKKGIEVDDYLQTSNESVYACGDVIDKTDKKLTPVSRYEGKYLASYLSGETKDKIHYPALPTIVFTSPELAQTGVSIADASENEEDYLVESIDASSWFSYAHRNEKISKIKIVKDRETGLLVGASCVNEEAGNLINYLSILIDKEIAAEELEEMVFAFPSLADDLTSIYS